MLHSPTVPSDRRDWSQSTTAQGGAPTGPDSPPTEHRRDRRARVALAVLLLWVVQAALSWAAAYRVTPMQDLRDQVAAGTVSSVRLVERLNPQESRW